MFTDNKNRTVAEIRQIFEEVGETMGDTGSVSWNFETKGYLRYCVDIWKRLEKYGEPDVFVEDNPEEVELNYYGFTWCFRYS